MRDRKDFQYEGNYRNMPHKPIISWKQTMSVDDRVRAPAGRLRLLIACVSLRLMLRARS